MGDLEAARRCDIRCGPNRRGHIGTRCAQKEHIGVVNAHYGANFVASTYTRRGIGREHYGTGVYGQGTLRYRCVQY
jgi:hypothetical protein